MPNSNQSLTKVALIYDFDGTLAKGNCAEYGLLPELGITDFPKFWGEVTQITKERDGDGILTYLGYLALKAKEADKREELMPEKLMEHGKKINLFPGVENWFQRINSHADSLDLALEHYIISSGIEEMINGTTIGKYFKKIFACKYHYDTETGLAKWPANAINYTTKTQYIFRINKGVLNSYDDKKTNEYVEPSSRPIPFDHMIYLGDGDTDIPCMRVVKDQGGCSLAVFDNEEWGDTKHQAKIEKLIAEDRVNYVVPGDYQPNSQLDITVKGVLRKIHRRLKQ